MGIDIPSLCCTEKRDKNRFYHNKYNSLSVINTIIQIKIF